MKISILPCVYKRNRKGRIKYVEPLIENPIICATFLDCECNVDAFKKQVSNMYADNDLYFAIDVNFN